MKKLLVAIFLAFPLVAVAQDTVIRTDGVAQSGRIIGGDATGLKLEVSLGGGAATGTITLRFSQVKEVVMADRETVQNSLGRVTKESIPALAQLWALRRPLLPVAGSLAGDIGLAYGHLLLKVGTQAQQAMALNIFTEIETRETDETLQGKATEGRLQALIALGRAGEAVEDAKKLAQSSEDPSTLIQAKYILAQASLFELRTLEKDNPRWTEDLLVRPVRNRLYNEALNLFLFATLFHGAETEVAARGIWGAIETAQLNKDTAQIRELATDLQVLYPSDPHAVKATTLLTTLPKKTKTKTEDLTEDENQAEK